MKTVMDKLKSANPAVPLLSCSGAWTGPRLSELPSLLLTWTKLNTIIKGTLGALKNHTAHKASPPLHPAHEQSFRVKRR